MAISDQATANSTLASSAQGIGDALAFYEGPTSPLTADQVAEVKTLHGVLARIATRAETVAGVGAGTFHPDTGGGPKGDGGDGS